MAAQVSCSLMMLPSYLDLALGHATYPVGLARSDRTVATVAKRW